MSSYVAILFMYNDEKRARFVIDRWLQFNSEIPLTVYNASTEKNTIENDYKDHTKIIAKQNASVQRSEKETEKLKQFITIDQTDDIEFLRNEVKYLWKILDDIDTCTDMAKSNDKWYRQQVEKLVQKRFQNIETDGCEIYRRECN